MTKRVTKSIVAKSIPFWKQLPPTILTITAFLACTMQAGQAPIPPPQPGQLPDAHYVLDRQPAGAHFDGNGGPEGALAPRKSHTKLYLILIGIGGAAAVGIAMGMSRGHQQPQQVAPSFAGGPNYANR